MKAYRMRMTYNAPANVQPRGVFLPPYNPASPPISYPPGYTNAYPPAAVAPSALGQGPQTDPLLAPMGSEDWKYMYPNAFQPTQAQANGSTLQPGTIKEINGVLYQWTGSEWVTAKMATDDDKKESSSGLLALLAILGGIGAAAYYGRKRRR